jgi:allophanate hydrolase
VAVDDEGAAVEVELHRLSVAAIGPLVCALPAPLGVGRIGWALGIDCTSWPTGALDISAHGCWPAYLRSVTV